MAHAQEALVEGYDEVRIQVDRQGHCLGATIIHDVGGVNESVRPFAVGPFDTAEDALAICQPYLTKQLSLW